jgi:glycine/D-amino acid oxidase-like deaminating enzyme
MVRNANYDVIVVGGGFFGCCLAVHLKESKGRSVVILEREGNLLQRASYANQARVHNGYHYPRSLLTALRCRVNFPRFCKDYADCIVSDFEKYYAVGGLFSKVTARQFRQYCERIGAPIARAPLHIRRLFNPNYVDDVFAVKEYAFDAVKLKQIIMDRLRSYDIEVRYHTEAESVRQLDGGLLRVTVTSPDGPICLTARSLLNCTYSRLNKLLIDSGLKPLYLKHEMTEMALVKVPEEIKDRSFTMMCGPFFSIMPFPPRNELYTLSHVRYTPHCQWFDVSGKRYRDPYAFFEMYPKRSNIVHMIKDVSRYMPCLSECRYVDSIWELKTVLPKSEVDDSRPVLYRRNCGLTNLTCLMGGKIDNIYDIIEFVDAASA